MSYLMGGVTAWFEATFDRMWWAICRSLMNIIDLLEKAFKFVVGAQEVVGADSEVLSAGSGDTLSYMFTRIFGSTGPFKNLYWQMVVLFVSLMVIFVIIGVIRAQFTKEPMESMKKMVGTSFWSMFKMVLVPIFFFLALMLTAQIFNFLLNAMDIKSKASLAETLCDCFCDGDVAKQNISYKSSYDAIAADYLSQDKFDFTLCILTSACLIVTIATAVIAVTKRFIKIFMYYITAPMVLSKSMLDDGKSWELWKDNLLAQLLGAGGVIIAMYLFIQIVPEIVDLIDRTFANKPPAEQGVAAILKIVFILGMSTVPASATAFIAQLVTQGAGQNESNDLMHAQQMLGNGMRLAGLAAGKALSGGLSALAGGGGGFSAAMRGGAGGAGAALTPTNTPTSNGGGGSPLGQTPSPLSGGGSNGGAGGNLGAAAMQSASSLGLSPMGGSGGGAGTPGGGFGGASGSGAAGSPGGSSAVGESPSPMGGPSFAPSGGSMQGQSSAAGTTGQALASGAGAMQRAGSSGGIVPAAPAGDLGAAAQQAGSSAPQESFGQMFMRDQKNSGLKHQGGIHSAIFRGGVIGAAIYGAVRLGARALTAAWSGAKGLGRLVKSGIGKIPIPGKGGKTFGDRWAEKSQERSAKRQLKQDAKLAKQDAKQKSRADFLDNAKQRGLDTAMKKDVKATERGGGLSPVSRNEQRYIDKQLDAFQKQKEGIDKTLSKGAYKDLSEDRKNAYRQQMLGKDAGRLQRMLGNSQYGRSDAVQNRFKNILGGAQQEGGEQ